MSFYSKRTEEPFHRFGSKVTLGEILPRLALLEDLVGGLRVLEVGVRDRRSLLQLKQFGAEQVVGISPRSLEGHDDFTEEQGIELIAMEKGSLEFASASFDCIIVNDCDGESEADDAFLGELRRVLAPDGVCILAFDVSSQNTNYAGRPSITRVNECFDEVQWIQQRPFWGVSLQSQDDSHQDMPVQLDLSYAKTTGAIDFMIALCGPVAPVADSKMIFEFPPELLRQQTTANAPAEVQELQDALAKAQQALSIKSESIRSLSKRIEPIRDAIRTQMGTGLPTEIVRNESRLQRIHELERQLSKVTAHNHMLQLASEETPSQNEPTHASLARERILSEQLETALNQNVTLQQNLSKLKRELELRASPSILNSEELLQLEIALVAKQNECDDLQRRLEVSERRLRVRVSATDNPVASNDFLNEESDISLSRVEELEKERKEQGQRILELERFYRESSAELVKLKETTDFSEVQRSREETKLKSKIAALVSALQVSESEVHSLRGLLDESYERQSFIRSASERDLDEVEKRFNLQREVSEKNQAELDTARREVFESRANFETAQRNLLAKVAQIDEMRTQFVGLQADKSALELVTGELSQELESTRKKFYALKADHEALMATSRVMIDERDVALELANSVGRTEDRVHELNKALEGSQAAIKRLEWENDSLESRMREKESALSEKQTELTNLENQLSLNSERYHSLQENERLARTHIVELEERVASGQKYITELHETISEHKDEIVELQELMHDVRREALDTKRDQAMHSERAEQLQREMFEAQEIIESLQSQILQMEQDRLSEAEQRADLETRLAIANSKPTLDIPEEAAREEKEKLVKILGERESEIQELEVQVAALLGTQDDSEARVEKLTKEKEALVEQVNQLAAVSLAYSESTEYIEFLQREIRQIGDENLRLNAKAEGRSSYAQLDDVIQTSIENDQLRSRVVLLDESKAVLKKELEKASETLALFQNEAERLNEEAILSAQQKNEFLDKVVVYEEQVKRLEAQIEQYELRSKEVDLQFRENQAVATDALEQLEAVEQRMLEAAGTLERYQNEKTAMLLRIQTLESEVQSLGANQNEREKTRRLKLAPLRDAQEDREEFTALRDQNERLVAEKEEMASEFAMREADVSEKLRAALDQQKLFEKQLSQVTSEANAYEKEAQAEIEELAEHILEARQREDILRSRIAELETMNTSADQAKGDNSEDILLRLRDELSAANGQTDEVRAELANKMNETRQLQVTLENLRDEFAEHMGEYAKVTEELEIVRASSNSPGKVRETEQNVARLESQLRSATQEQERLRRIAQRAEEELVEAELRVSQVEGSLKEKSRQVELLRSEVAEKAERLRRLSKSLDNR